MIEFKIAFYYCDGKPVFDYSEIKDFESEEDAVDYAIAHKEENGYRYYSVLEWE